MTRQRANCLNIRRLKTMPENSDTKTGLIIESKIYGLRNGRQDKSKQKYSRYRNITVVLMV